MATKMLFLCSCGVSFDIGDSTGMTEHIDANVTHTITEEYVHSSVVASASGSSENN